MKNCANEQQISILNLSLYVLSLSLYILRLSIELFCLLVNFFFALISSFSLAYNDCLFMFPNVFAHKNNKICKFKTLWNRGTLSK